jgi:GNAT superfamily N-acetyltransferase
MDIRFRTYKKSDFSELHSMIIKLYDEDPGYVRINDYKIKNTVNELTKHKEKGKIIIFQSGKEIIGYSILLNYWSNEFGGNILIIDEVYILPNYRKKGYGKMFLKHLTGSNKKTSKGIQLEVGKKNRSAYQLYKDFGFDEINNKIMFYNFNQDKQKEM